MGFSNDGTLMGCRRFLWPMAGSATLMMCRFARNGGEPRRLFDSRL